MGFGWIVPLNGLLFVSVVVLAVIRMAGGSTGGQAGYGSGEPEELRREVPELKEERRKLQSQR